MTNIGLALGALGAGVVLSVDTRPAYVAMICVDAATFALGGLVLCALPRFAPTRTTSAAQRWPALQDRRYLAFAAACSLASLQYYVLIVAVPLWVVLETEAPRWIPAGLFYMAALLVAALQVPMTRSIDGPRSAARLLAGSGPVFFIAWIFFVLAADRPATLAIVLLLFAVALHSVAEVWQAGGSFELSFSLADSEAQGQYQGLFGMGQGIAAAIAPLVVVNLCITWGAPGWLVLGVLVSLSGVAASWFGCWSDHSDTSDVRP